MERWRVMGVEGTVKITGVFPEVRRGWVVLVLEREELLGIG